MKRIGLALAGLLVLAGCSQQRLEDLLIACPGLSLPADVADLTRHQPGAPPDLSTMTLDARIQAIEGNCRRGRSGQEVVATLAVRFEVERGPAAAAPAAELPWFVAVLESGTDRILTRQAFRQPVSFPANVARSSVTSPQVQVQFRVAEGRRVQDQRIVVGFLLNETELALNRRRGPR